jgi:hypothetical protein
MLHHTSNIVTLALKCPKFPPSIKNQFDNQSNSKNQSFNQTKIGGIQANPKTNFGI